MKRIAGLAALLSIGLSSGCVERRFTVYSEPPGALVYLNDRYLGPTPVDGYITYYGKQQFMLIKEGYEPLKVVQEYSPPWYDWPGIDFITENIWPFKLRDVRQFSYKMMPLTSIPPDDVRARAEELRARGQNIGVPAPPRPLAPAPAPTPPAPPDATLPTPRPVSPPSAGVTGP
ncbi:MAG: PEGA domain-containing protein [Gemmataceae bacterium]